MADSTFHSRFAPPSAGDDDGATAAVGGVLEAHKRPASPSDRANGGPSELTAPRQGKKAKAKRARVPTLAFLDEHEDEDTEPGGSRADMAAGRSGDDGDGGEAAAAAAAGGMAANAAVGVAPRALTKAAMRRDAAARAALRQEFLAIQEAVKAAEIAIPFVFYDGTNIPGGMVRMKKGDFVWLFLDRSRKVGARQRVGGKANPRREWARVSVDDLMLVRGSIIIPPHYDFYFFILNKTVGPGGQPLFDFSPDPPTVDDDVMTTVGKASVPPLEGLGDNPVFTKVVDRRWYERNKHIFPASTWQDFDPEKDYTSEIKKDIGGNTYFFSR